MTSATATRAAYEGKLALLKALCQSETDEVLQLKDEVKINDERVLCMRLHFIKRTSANHFIGLPWAIDWTLSNSWWTRSNAQ
jgi:hypothetical protein